MTSDNKNAKSTSSISGDLSAAENDGPNKKNQVDDEFKEKKLQENSVKNKTVSKQSLNEPETKTTKKNISFRFSLLLLFIVLISIIFMFKDDVNSKLLVLKTYLNEQYLKKNKDEISDQLITGDNVNQDGFAEFKPEIEELSESVLAEISKPSPEELSQEINEQISQLAPYEAESVIELQQDIPEDLSENVQSSTIIAESETRSNVSDDIKLQEKIKKQRYINILEEISRNIKKLSFNSTNIEIENKKEESNKDLELSDKFISKLLSLVKVTKIQEPETGLLTNDFYLIIREHLKLRILSAKVTIASNLDVSPQADLTEASFLLEKYFIKDSVFAEIKEELDNLIKLTDTEKVITDHQGE